MSGDTGGESSESAGSDEEAEEPEAVAESPQDRTKGITESDRERIREFLNTTPEERTPDLLRPEGRTPANAGAVTVQTCISMREDMREADTVREVMESYRVHTSEVMKHVYGECSHTHDVPPTASPQIGADECREFRNDYALGSEISTIADEYHRADNTATRHVFGRCSHDPDPRDLSVSDVPAEDCRRLRDTYRGNPKVDVRGAATAMCLRPAVAATHLFGYCDCETDIDPAESDEEWTPQGSP